MPLRFQSPIIDVGYGSGCDGVATTHLGAVRSASQMSTTQHLSSMLLDKETDARFWAQTGYKPGQKLNPANVADRAMTKVWMDIFAKVKAEDTAGKLVLTYNHPHVEQHLDNAQQANAAAIAHVEAGNVAAAAGDDTQAAYHREQAAKAAEIASHSIAGASSLQPPTASPAVADAAAHEVATATGVQPLPPVMPTLPPGHAAHGRNGQPSHPDLATPHAPIPAHPARGGRPPQHGWGRHGQDATVEIVPHPGQDARVEIMPTRDAVAVVQAMNAPQVVAATHADATNLTAPQSTVSPEKQAQIRALAAQGAAANPSPFVGVVLGPLERGEVVAFASHDAAMGWYGELADAKPTPYKYIAVFNKADPTLNNDAFGDASALYVQGATDAPPPRVVTKRCAYETIKEVSDPNVVAAVGVTGLAALFTIFAVNKAKRR